MSNLNKLLLSKAGIARSPNKEENVLLEAVDEIESYRESEILTAIAIVMGACIGRLSDHLSYSGSNAIRGTNFEHHRRQEFISDMVIDLKDQLLELRALRHDDKSLSHMTDTPATTLPPRIRRRTSTNRG